MAAPIGSDERDAVRRRRRWPWVVGGVMVLVLVVLGALAVRASRELGRPLPEFASLAADPDPALTGTVAYYEGATACVRVIDASGRGARDVYCLDPAPDEKTGGPETGPHLAWRPDGRLEVTAFRWPAGGEPAGAWQRLVDVATGAVEDVPAADVPDDFMPTPIPAVGPDGQELTAEVHDQRLVIELRDGDQTRTLLKSDRGPTDYDVGNGGQPVWSPDGSFAVLFDGRLLLTTVTAPSTTRILVDYQIDDGFGCCWASGEIRRFAVTDRTLVSP